MLNYNIGKINNFVIMMKISIIHKIGSTPPLFIEVSALSQKSEWSYACVLWVLIMSLFLRFLYGTFTTV